MTINHEKRRADIAAITIDLIAREGIEATTIRRIAAEAGFSTTAITHYFAGKQDLLVWAFQSLSEEGERRFSEARLEFPSDPIEAMLTMVPWCPVNVRRWKTYLAFWDHAARDADVASLVAQGASTGRAAVKTLLRGETSTGENFETACTLLHAFIQGLALQMLVDPKCRNEEIARALLKEAFEVALRKAR